MTKQEFIDKYGDYVVKFDSYYKYSFSFKAPLSEDMTLHVSIGGNADDIYREEISVDSLVTVKELDPFSGTVFKHGKEVESFYDY